MKKIFVVLLPLFLYSCTKKEKLLPPNIIIILADDLGYADVKWNNKEAYAETPNLTKLADEGAILTDCYSASSMCSPSRAGLLTGRVPTRVGVHDWIKEIYKQPYSNIHLPSSELTLSEVAKQGGYQTAVIGKWHLNNEFNSGNNSDPNNHGFDYWYCTPTHALPTHRNPNNFYDNGIAVGDIGTEKSPVFASQIIADKILEWIDNKNNNTPFLLYIPFQEPHVICDAPETIKQKYLERIRKGEIPLNLKSGEKGLGQAEYYASIENMDIAIGRIINKLKKEGLLENTLLLFTSDNGPDSNRNYKGRLQSVGETKPLRGRKRWLLEGGIRQPSILFWKGKIKPKTIINAPIGHIDILPTVSELLGISLPKQLTIDGESILKDIDKGNFDKRDKPLHWHFHSTIGGPNSVMRRDNWVITASWDKNIPLGRFKISDIDKIKTAQLENFKMYNLNTDLGQEEDISYKKPKIFDDLKRELLELHKSVKTECPDSTQFMWNNRLQQIVDTKYKKSKN